MTTWKFESHVKIVLTRGARKNQGQGGQQFKKGHLVLLRKRKKLYFRNLNVFIRSLIEKCSRGIQRVQCSCARLVIIYSIAIKPIIS